MAVKPKPARPSSRYLDRLLLSLRSKKRLPTRIWPDGDHPLRRCLEPSSSDVAAAISTDDPPAPLKLSHPLLRAFESSAVNTPQFSQALAQLLVSGLARHPLAAGRAIKALCSSPSSLPFAVYLFSAVDGPDAFLSNTIIRSYLSSCRPEAALSFLRRRAPPSLVPPNHFTFPLLAKLFAELGLVSEGRSTHALIAKLGFEADLFIRNTLIYMYSSFGDVDAAKRLFDSNFESDLVTWNSMVDGYVKNGMVAAARQLFDEMPERDVVSWNVMIAWHAGAGDMGAAKELFLSMPERDVVSWNSMIDGYARTGEVGAAREYFDAVPYKNLVSWNIMLALYTRMKDYQECLKLFDDMLAVEDVKPNEATFVSVLTACANLGRLERGQWVHSLIKDHHIKIKLDVLLSTALVTMYAKCGDTELAREVFDSMEERSVVSWNSMIVGYGLHGQGEKALEMFMAMEKRGPRPNEATFVCILSACAHGGMVFEGWRCFHRMIRHYGIEPKVEHFGCMMDLLSRAGLLKDSEELAKRMPTEHTPALWGALMAAARTHCDWELGETVGRKLIEIQPRDVGPYVLLSNIYAARGRWDDVEKVRDMMKEHGLEKAAGFSSVSVNKSGFDQFVEENIPQLARKA
ncbi:pentatricopeptide repeat-containing protein At2g44880-like [Phoenix dactylifera]|uniref:Pentatricopeptide repeat-containing protein At2g44880-like n=1 Tax=Phoenix dactylifera TaxID=42345 RepID=A0A8B7BZS9_PHODC|nr:pentatricopeptide repeat-containing protein At2g44880-like [Phoenix dactylifera]